MHKIDNGISFHRGDGKQLIRFLPLQFGMQTLIVTVVYSHSIITNHAMVNPPTSLRSIYTLLPTKSIPNGSVSMGRFMPGDTPHAIASTRIYTYMLL